jgi:hypothetical protein
MEFRIKNAAGWLTACALTVLLAAAAEAATDISVRVDIGGAPPPPRMVFRTQPHVVYEAAPQVYVVDDPACGDRDCFRYAGYWYTFSAGYWYRAHSWRGPFAVVHPRMVPAAIYRVPPGRWKHHAVYAEERHEARTHVRIERREDRREERHAERHERHGKGHDGDDHDDRGEHGEHGEKGGR